jgi:hypothetical protein
LKHSWVISQSTFSSVVSYTSLRIHKWLNG